MTKQEVAQTYKFDDDLLNRFFKEEPNSKKYFEKHFIHISDNNGIEAIRELWNYAKWQDK